MNKKRILIISGVVVLLVLIGAGVYVWKLKNASQGPSPEVASVLTPTPEELLTWEDVSGFSFQYPKGIDVNKHDEDQENYAHVELTHKDHPGSIILWAKDLPAGVVDAASWVKKEKTFTGANILDTTLGGEPGKKVLLTTPMNKLFVGTVYDDLLWYIETTPEDSEYWNKVHDTILSSYAFPTLTSDSQGAGSGGGQEEVDEEEVVE
jgi:hypothetical protein